MTNPNEGRQTAYYRNKNAYTNREKSREKIGNYLCFTIKSLRQIDGLITALATLALVFVTAALGLIAYWQYGTLEKTDETLKTQQRAWIAPRLPKIASSIEQGETLVVEMTYTNTGSQPALNVTDLQDAKIIPVPLDGRGVPYWGDKTFPENKTCPRPFPDSLIIQASERTAFVGGDYRDSIYFWPNTGVPDDFLQRKVTLLLQGCIIYETLKKPRFSAYCVYLDPEKGRSPSQWRFKFCPNGNYTDEYKPYFAPNFLNQTIINQPIITREVSPTTVPLDQLMTRPKP